MPETCPSCHSPVTIVSTDEGTCSYDRPGRCSVCGGDRDTAEARAIVRDLCKSDPFDREQDDSLYCVLCNGTQGSSDDRVQHRGTCPWLRARRLVEKWNETEVEEGSRSIPVRVLFAFTCPNGHQARADYGEVTAHMIRAGVALVACPECGEHMSEKTDGNLG